MRDDPALATWSGPRAADEMLATLRRASRHASPGPVRPPRIPAVAALGCAAAYDGMTGEERRLVGIAALLLALAASNGLPTPLRIATGVEGLAQLGRSVVDRLAVVVEWSPDSPAMLTDLFAQPACPGAAP